MEAGGIEPPSEKGPRKASTGLDQVRFSSRTWPLTGLPLTSFPYCLTRLPENIKPRQPNGVASPRRIRLRPVQRDRQAVRLPCCLSSAGVFVIVVGNYFCAAFYEASGASTCNFGFQHPRRNQCAPVGSLVVMARKPSVYRL